MSPEIYTKVYWTKDRNRALSRLSQPTQRRNKMAAYMRCANLASINIEDLDWKRGVFVQEKADGMFVNLNRGPYGLTVTTRQGKEVPTAAPEFETLARTLPHGMQTHGEMLVRGPEGILPREVGNGLIHHYIKSGTPLGAGLSFFFKVWDCIPLPAAEEKGRYSHPYSGRFAVLQNMMYHAQGKALCVVGTVQTKVCNTKEEAFDFYKRILAKGGEGVVLKNPRGIWRDGTSRDQVKVKPSVECDLIVVDFKEGTGKNEGNLGALECETLDGRLSVAVSGLTDELRADVWEHREEYQGAIVTVRFNRVMEKDGRASLFLPRFVEFRPDKMVPDSLDDVLAIQDSAFGIVPAPKKEVPHPEPEAPDPAKRDCVVDIETTGVQKGAALLSIGAVCGDAEFYAVISPGEEGSREPETMRWWDSRHVSDAARAEVFMKSDEDCYSVRGALVEFVKFIIEHQPRRFWGNAPDFDFGHLQYWMEREAVGVPWKYYQLRDIRTIADYVEPLERLEIMSRHTPHIAIEDARAENETLRAFLAMVEKRQKEGEK